MPGVYSGRIVTTGCLRKWRVGKSYVRLTGRRLQSPNDREVSAYLMLGQQLSTIVSTVPLFQAAWSCVPSVWFPSTDILPPDSYPHALGIPRQNFTVESIILVRNRGILSIGSMTQLTDIILWHWLSHQVMEPDVLYKAVIHWCCCKNKYFRMIN